MSEIYNRLKIVAKIEKILIMAKKINLLTTFQKN